MHGMHGMLWLSVGAMLVLLILSYKNMSAVSHVEIRKTERPAKTYDSRQLDLFDTTMKLHELSVWQFCINKCLYFVNKSCANHDPYNSLRNEYPAPQCVWIKDVYHVPDSYADYTQVRWGQNLNSWNSRKWKLKDILAYMKIHTDRVVPDLHTKCNATFIPLSGPMMWVDEYEMMSKLLLNVKSQHYLEWGTGDSAQFYPALAKNSYLIDGYLPWCKIVANLPRVKCLQNELKQMKFVCVNLTSINGDKFPQGKFGFPIPGTPKEDQDHAALQYVRSVEKHNLKGKLDLALVDGRLRVSCALYLLNVFATEDAILAVHDFQRKEVYESILKYYDIIGRTRSLAIMKMKPVNKRPEGWQTAYQKYIHVWI